MEAGEGVFNESNLFLIKQAGNKKNKGKQINTVVEYHPFDLPTPSACIRVHLMLIFLTDTQGQQQYVPGGSTGARASLRRQQSQVHPLQRTPPNGLHAS